MPPWPLLFFAAALCFFHASEFLLAAVFMPDQLSARSLLLSWPYVAAMSAGLAEYHLEAWWPPTAPLKQLTWLAAAGAALMVAGEWLRKAAMLTAASNFTHDIRTTRHPSHRLVTHGVYRFVRHPGYLGWFVWAVATQVLLANPACCLLFTLLCWRFFRARVAYEERTLAHFFGDAWLDYAAATPSGLPFIA